MSLVGPRQRILVLPLAAIVIASLVTFKLTRARQSFSGAEVVARRPAAPLSFLAFDSHNQLVKFERYLGRHEILLVFFDAEVGADRDPVLQRIRQHADKLQQRGVQVVAVSTALPQHNRQAAERGGPFPFPLLSDPEFRIHQLWGRYDEEREQTLTGVFWIDRGGFVAWPGKFPQPEQHLDRLLAP
jgi:peroxiredoxin